MLRVLIAQAVDRIDPLPPPKGRPLRTFLRLSAEDTAAAHHEAASRGLRVSTWIATLVRRRVFGRPRFERPDELTLYAILSRLQDIVRELQGCAHASTNASGSDASQLQDRIESFRAEVRQMIIGVRRAFDGDLAYWSVIDGW